MPATPLPPALVDPDGQPPLPLAAAFDYAQAVTAWAQDEPPPGVTLQAGLRYGPHRLQAFDVHAPAGVRDAPVLVFWHGGGFTNGYRQWVRFMAPAVTALGIVLVAPSYRLAPDHPLPHAFADALALLADVQRRAPDWGGAPGRVLLGGHSAGGLLAALVALRPAARAAAGLAPGDVRGCLPISGVMDLHDPAPPPGSLEERVYTTVLRGGGPDDDTLLSPLYWAAGNRVPFVLTWGERDSARVLKSNRRLAALLGRQPARCTAVVEPGRDHFQTHTALHDAGDGWYARLAALAGDARREA